MRYVESLIPFEPTWKLIMKVTDWTTYVQLADFLHIKSGSVSGAKKRGNIPIDWLYKISSHYKCSMDWLLTGEGPMYTDHPAAGETREALNEHQQTYTPSSSSFIKLNEKTSDKLREVIEAVEKVLDEKNLSLSPKKKAEAILLLYEDLTEGKTEGSAIPERALRLVKLAS